MSSSSRSDRDRTKPTESGGVICRPAEESFRKGLIELKRGQTRAALALFEAALEIERRSGVASLQPRYLSYYGLILSEHPARAEEGLALCRRAAQEEFFNPDLFYNLARVQLRLGKRRRAWLDATQGLSLDPRHQGLRVLARGMGLRRRPPLPFLSRSNVLNVTLGRIFRGGA